MSKHSQTNLEVKEAKEKEDEEKLIGHLKEQFGYTNGEFIAEGNFGSVWKFKKGDEDVAIKIVNKGYRPEEFNNQKFAYENEKIGQYVVGVQGETAQKFKWLMWFEQELMDGDLKSLVLKKGIQRWDEPIPIRNALSEGDMKKLMRDLAITLAELESMDIVHCDLNLRNIMFKRSKGNYTFKLGDFGCSEKIKTGFWDNTHFNFEGYKNTMGKVMNANWETPPTGIETTIGALEAVEGKERTMKKVLQVLVKEGILEQDWEEMEKIKKK